jgi:hypothetical protein
MTVFLRYKPNGHIIRRALVGNVSIDGDRIVLVDDPRGLGTTVTSMPVSHYEIIRMTEDKLETPEAVKVWAKREGAADVYIRNVFKEV